MNPTTGPDALAPAPRAARPSVMYVCVHNAGRSQMAAAWTRALGGDRVQVRSSGSQPADAVNPAAVEAMAEVGIDVGAVSPRVLTRQDMEVSDVVVTMGCGDECPYVPGVRREDWVLADPAGQPVEAVRPCATRSAPAWRNCCARSASSRSCGQPWTTGELFKGPRPAGGKLLTAPPPGDLFSFKSWT